MLLSEAVALIRFKRILALGGIPIELSCGSESAGFQRLPGRLRFVQDRFRVIALAYNLI